MAILKSCWVFLMKLKIFQFSPSFTISNLILLLKSSECLSSNIIASSVVEAWSMLFFYWKLLHFLPTAVIEKALSQLTNFLPLVFFHTVWNVRRPKVFWCFLRGIKRNQWHEMGQSRFLNEISILTFLMPFLPCVAWWIYLA